MRPVHCIHVFLKPARSTPNHANSRTLERTVENGMALCLSGGGYRAMLFHVGAVWRLHETGFLSQLKRVSSVSGGSITAGVLALNWERIAAGDRTELEKTFIEPLREMASTTIDVGSILRGLALPGRVSDKVTAAFAKHLFGKATLQDLPGDPVFVINATNVQSGALWRFRKAYMGDYLVGEIVNPEVSIAKAVTASSAFPPFLSPVQLDLDSSAFTLGSGSFLHNESYTKKVILTDGGVYDNLGLETVWKRYSTVLVSDGGGKMASEGAPASDWARHSRRVLDLVDNQVRALRKRQLIASYKAAPSDAIHRDGTYWGIRSDISNYGAPDALPCPHARTMALAETPTRLAAMSGELQQRLINWGYAVCDAALRRHVNNNLPPPAGFPYLRAGV
ncbi:patatin-like phospholipase family protein [Sinorhizobium medicae]|nr:patatin-like phospholipase family protein [Sinorhizobium medicae]MDX0568435.1 patatin-like phospholipase family protein [Sinorhizobium medicae]MDX0581157.1 patatin-like phospholipase family protein [Sinorhizobium medicae]MDX0729488.1 patatin-like phospholipase family protein [Sinorhizobium medicae]MDX0735699.1 patatin-like phospholipase family protein [Sinorhizobium medicae]